MTKRQLIDEIITRNRTAQPSLLARFDPQDLQDYLDRLCVTTQPRLRGDPRRYDRYFEVSPIPAAPSVAPQQNVEDGAVDVFFRSEPDDVSAGVTPSGGSDDLTDLAEPGAKEVPTDAQVDMDAEGLDDHLLIRPEPVIRWRERQGSSPVAVSQPPVGAAEEDSGRASGPSRLAAAPRTQAQPPADTKDEDTESWLF